jgi:MoaA/NifB/PqqE/SkfB family radical SAM enzyme
VSSTPQKGSEAEASRFSPPLPREAGTEGAPAVPGGPPGGAPRLSPGDLELAGVLDGKQTFIGPEQVVIDLTNRCNNNCIGCWTRSPLLRDLEASPRWQSEEIPYDSMLHLLNDLMDLGTRRVRFTGGGEPLMHPRLDDILRACKERQLLACVTTNGTLLTKERAELFAKLPIDELAVSLWAGTPEAYGRTHPNKTGRTFERIAESLSLLAKTKKLRPKVTLANVILAMNCTEVEPMYDFARRVGADAVYFAVLDPIVDRTEGLLLKPDQVLQLEHQLDRIERKNEALPPRQRIELENWEGFRRRVRSSREQQKGEYDKGVIDAIPCYVGWIFCRILANGDVVPCCRGSNFPLGNINTDGFRKTWTGERYTEFREKAKTLSKNDPYFRPIGCHMTCDNLMHNQVVHERLSGLSPEARQGIDGFLSTRGPK